MSQSYTVSTEQLLAVFLAGMVSGAGTSLNMLRPDLGVDRAQRIARVQVGGFEQSMDRDPAIRHEVLTVIHQSLGGTQETSTWMRRS